MENRRVRMTKRLIGGALLELLQKKSLDKISVKEICQRADVNRSTFYDHYDDIYDLLADLENEFVSQLPSQYASESIREQLLEFVNYVWQHRQLYGAIRRYSDLVGEKLVQIIMQNYESAMRPRDEEERFIQMRIIYVVNGSASLLDDWIAHGVDRSPAEMTDVLMSLARGVFEGKS